MSADIMIFSKEDNNHFEGDRDNAVFIGESSMGDPHDSFSEWFVSNYSQMRSLLTRVSNPKGNKHAFTYKFKDSDYKACEEAIKTMDTHKEIDKGQVLEYLKSCIGKHVSVEYW